MDLFRDDFGYQWPWTWGHVIGAVVFALAAGAAWRVARPRLGLVCAALSAWAIAGAGSGRSSLMVLLARAAGAESRLEVQVGDMRAMPFAPATFDGAVSAFAIDHLRRADVDRTFAEMTRVLKPGGEFLLLVVNQDAWIRTALPFFVHHGWPARLSAAPLASPEAHAS